MTLNLAAYLNILDHCVVDGITHTELLSALIVAVFLGIPYWKANLSAKHPHKGGQTHA